VILLSCATFALLVYYKRKPPIATTTTTTVGNHGGGGGGGRDHKNLDPAGGGDRARNEGGVLGANGTAQAVGDRCVVWLWVLFWSRVWLVLALV